MVPILSPDKCPAHHAYVHGDVAHSDQREKFDQHALDGRVSCQQGWQDILQGQEDSREEHGHHERNEYRLVRGELRRYWPALSHLVGASDFAGVPDSFRRRFEDVPTKSQNGPCRCFCRS